MNIKEVIEKQVKAVKLNQEEIFLIERKAEKLTKSIESRIKKRKIKADVFIGGSLAKRTLLKKEKYDVDVFVRFDKKYKDNEISTLLAGIAGKAIKIHGSRDYFQIKDKKIVFEVVPVIKIKNPKEARNVTDLSYFHVEYVKKKIEKNPKLAGEILLAKSFCYSQNCYGAESFIRGFSGYALELLVIYYKSFLNFIKAASNSKDKIIIDMEKHYKNKQEILNNLNEAKLSSPIVFVDSTCKSRNALAALSEETFSDFKEACRKFLKKPNEKFFEEKKINKKEYNLILKARTDRQEGDIAGSKLLKFYNFFASELEKYFFILDKEFEYSGKKYAGLYFSIKAKKFIIHQGPPVTALKNALEFKKRHKKIFIRNKRVYAREKISFTAGKFVNKFKEKNRKRTIEMGIIKLEII